MIYLPDKYCNVSVPVLFNCWKHHSGFIKTKLIDFKNKSDLNPEMMLNELQQTGNSIMDLYTGSLTPYQISDLILKKISQKYYSDKNSFINWLEKDQIDYRTINLKDNSGWTLRLSENEERFIHIHPARYSAHSIRVRAKTLKCSVLYMVFGKDELMNKEHFGLLNRLRKDYLNLPPLKSLQSASAIIRLITVMNKS